jgi:hypothetical protein
MKSAFMLFAIGTLLVSCAKKKDYDAIYKESTFSKDLLSSDPNDPYVYVPSVENTPMNVTASRPYWIGEQKLVVFKFKENNLEVLEIPSDKRFVQNENNFSPVFNLAISHKDFRCAEDQYGDCSNKEEEVDDAAWQSKRFFKADFANLTVLETNSLPEQLTNLFQKCFSDLGSEVKSLKIDQDSLNVTVQRTIKAGIDCADVSSFDDLRNLTFNVNYHYSFVKLSKIASQNYKAVDYPFEDQNTFGFFTTTQKKLSADNRTTIDSEITYLNRWNPERKEIVYYLNDAFYEEGMETIKAATERGVNAVNSSFTRAGVDLKIRLADGRGVSIGDLRNNFLVLVKDPQASGLIGYGPSIANPLTGEILKGQTVMYYGTIRKFIQDTYEELVAEQTEKAEKAASEAAALATEAVANGQVRAGVEQEMERANNLSKELSTKLLSQFNVSDTAHTHHSSPVRDINENVVSSKLVSKLKGEIFSHDRVLKHHSIEDMVEEYSRNNMYHESMVNWHGALESAIGAGELNLAGAKPWSELSEEDKDKIINKILPYVWIPTLVHELGHNLGLRHNFNGSEDKANYYSKDEGGKLGLEREVTYSSVMDYAYSSLNQLPIMGKYDIAALAFGYNREVATKDGKIIKMPKATLEEMKKDGSLKDLHDFKFCTDEHVAVNPSCKRFDEGSTLSEIAQHHVKAYKKNFDKRMKRNNRLRFTGVDDGTHYLSVRNTFQGLRLFFEIFDRIKGLYPSLPAEQWESIPFLKDLKAATKIAADFYLEVLKTPDVHCAIINKSTSKIAGVVPLKSITQDAISCFDDENIAINKERFGVIGQTGMHLNHARGPHMRSDLKADPSQLEVRGLWMDKVLAMEFLTKRDLGISTFDDYRSSFLDHAEFKNEILSTYLDLMTDQVTLKTEIELANGQKMPIEHTFDVEETHVVRRSFSSSLNRHLGITLPTIDLREIFHPQVMNNLMTSDDKTQTLGLLNNLTVYRVTPTVWLDTRNGEEEVEITDGQNRVSSRFFAYRNNTLAKSLIKQRNLRKKLEKLDRQKIIEILLARTRDTPAPAEISEELKPVYNADVADLEAFLMGRLPEDSYLHKILTIMSK